MGVHAPWAKHAQIEWENRAADTTLPLWLRVACLAYGRHEANGHANFGRGWLAMGSCSECLIVPAHAIEGPLGSAEKPCAVHDRKVQQKRARLRVVS